MSQKKDQIASAGTCPSCGSAPELEAPGQMWKCGSRQEDDGTLYTPIECQLMRNIQRATAAWNLLETATIRLEEIVEEMLAIDPGIPGERRLEITLNTLRIEIERLREASRIRDRICCPGCGAQQIFGYYDASENWACGSIRTDGTFVQASMCRGQQLQAALEAVVRLGPDSPVLERARRILPVDWADQRPDHS